MKQNSPIPAITVVIPARNERDYIARAIRSALEQTYRGRIEVIAVDNGSSDGTDQEILGIIDGEGAGRVRLVREVVAGVGRARNAGAAAAQGTLLIFLDADSVMSPNLAAAVAEAHSDGRRAGSIRVVADGGSRVDRAFFALMELGKVRFGIRAQMLFADRTLFEEVGGFDPRLRLGEDVDFLQRARERLKSRGQPGLAHITEGEIRTSPRRLAANHHFGLVAMFARWLLAYMGIGRRSPY